MSAIYLSIEWQLRGLNSDPTAEDIHSTRPSRLNYAALLCQVNFVEVHLDLNLERCCTDVFQVILLGFISLRPNLDLVIVHVWSKPKLLVSVVIKLI